MRSSEQKAAGAGGFQLSQGDVPSGVVEHLAKFSRDRWSVSAVFLSVAVRNAVVAVPVHVHWEATQGD